MSSVENDCRELIEEVLAPHTNHPYGSCVSATSELCDECSYDSSISIAREVGKREENDRLRAAFVELTRDGGYVVRVSDVLVLFEVTR